MEFMPADDKPVAEGDPVEWDPEKLFEHSEMMTQLKKKIYDTAKSNIDEAQRKDKYYYDQKHADPKVIHNVFTFLYSGMAYFGLYSQNLTTHSHLYLFLSIRSSHMIP